MLAKFSLTFDPVVGVLIAGGFALLFGAAASHKLRDLREFSAVFAAYELAPGWVRLELVWLIPLMELAVACGLLVPGTRPAAAALGVSLLIVYSIAIGRNLRAGRTAIACGCGGFGQRSPIAGWMVWRNLSLAVLLAAAWVPWNVRAFEFTDGLTVFCGLAALSALYSCMERLLSQPGLGANSALERSR